MKRDDAEDVWLTAVIQAPAYLDAGLIRERHLSQRGRRVLDRVVELYDAGWDRLEVGQLDLPAEVLRSVPARLARPEAQVAVAEAEAVIVEAWSRQAMAQAHRRAAELCEREGTEAADAFLWGETSRIKAETSGVDWKTAADVAGAYVEKKRRQLRAAMEAQANERHYGSGFGAIDVLCDYWEPGRLTLVQGYTSDGKSTLVLQILAGLAETGIHGAMINLEDPAPVVGGRLVANYLDRKDLGALMALDSATYGPEEIAVVEGLIHDEAGLHGLPLDVIHKPGWKIEQVCTGLIDAGRRGCRVGAVDYIQNLLQPGDNGSQVLEIYANRMKAAAGSVGMHLIVVSQIVRPPGAQRAREDLPPPGLFSAKHGGVETAAETILSPFRPKKDLVRGYEPAQIIVPKAKDNGTGSIDLWWCPVRHIYVMDEQRELGEGGWRP